MGVVVGALFQMEFLNSFSKFKIKNCSYRMHDSAVLENDLAADTYKTSNLVGLKEGSKHVTNRDRCVTYLTCSRDISMRFEAQFVASSSFLFLQRAVALVDAGNRLISSS